MSGFDGWGLKASSSIPGDVQHVSLPFDMFRQAPTGEAVKLSWIRYADPTEWRPRLHSDAAALGTSSGTLPPQWR